MPYSGFAQKIPDVQAGSIDNAAGTTNQLLFGEPAGNVFINEVYVSQDDTIAHSFSFLLSSNGGSTFQYLFSVQVPAGSGVLGALPIAVFTTEMPVSLVGLPLAPPFQLYWAADVAMTSGKTAHAVAIGGLI